MEPLQWVTAGQVTSSPNRQREKKNYCNHFYAYSQFRGGQSEANVHVFRLWERIPNTWQEPTLTLSSDRSQELSLQLAFIRQQRFSFDLLYLKSSQNDIIQLPSSKPKINEKSQEIKSISRHFLPVNYSHIVHKAMLKNRKIKAFLFSNKCHTSNLPQLHLSGAAKDLICIKQK